MWFVLLLGFVLGAMRVGGITHIAFQAAAHLYVGGLFSAWLFSIFRRPIAWWLFVLFLVMTVLETICFFHGPFKFN